MSNIYSLDFNIKDSKIRFDLHKTAVEKLNNEAYRFGFSDSLFGEIVYYRTYSRTLQNGLKERWPDTVVRVVNGVMTVRKWWFKIHHLKWSDDDMQKVAFDMAISMLKMHWLPPGRGVQNMGSEYVYERGSMSLYNCAFIKVEDLAEDSAWLMDCLMSGVGVGFEVVSKEFRMYLPNRKRILNYEIPDSKEGWVESTRDLIRSYLHPNKSTIKFDYSKIRPFGTPIKGFGGTASGPKPLIELHDRIRVFCEEYISGQVNSVRLTADIENAIGVCVIAGNVRRSAEIAIGSPTDETFLNLKNYITNPERMSFGFMSNNTVRLSEKDHFNMIPQITTRILDNGEPGIMNLVNVQKYGRYGQEIPDLATGLNPCGEIPLESAEVCNLSEVFPTRCSNKTEFFQAVKSATLYSSTVSLYPTHSVRTNEVVARNRRIGVSLSGISEWMDTYKTNECVRWMKDAYRLVKDYNQQLANQAGVVPSVRLTTVKPSGTISQMVGVPSGMHFPLFKYAVRRIIVSSTSPIYPKLLKAGYRNEPLIKVRMTDEYKEGEHQLYDKYHTESESFVYTEDPDSTIFEVPIYSGQAREAKTVSSWEQFSILGTLQRDWADNSVSATISFDKNTEANQLNHQLAQFIPVIKSVSILPHSDKGEYNQMPYEGIDKEEYEKRVSELKPIDWSDLEGEELREEKYCTNDSCAI